MSTEQAVSAVEAINELAAHAQNVADLKDPRVRPGGPERFTAGCTILDCIPQGDVYIDIVAEMKFEDADQSVEVPRFDPETRKVIGHETYKRRELKDEMLNDPAAMNAYRQLALGNSVGQRHCLETHEGVKVFNPPVYNEQVLTGPALLVDREVRIVHPKHGPVSLIPGFLYELTYQREYDKELKEQQRRALD